MNLFSVDTGILSSKTILVVDDEIDLREPIADELQYFGARTLQAGSGRDALAIVEREKVDAVISDIRMPDGDGIDLLKNIKKIQHNFPVVMLITGFSDLPHEDAYHLGAYAVLTKPFGLDDIVRAAAHILTPKAKVWSGPPPSTFQTEIKRTFASFSKAVSDGDFDLGQGGMFIRSTESSLQRATAVSVSICFQEGEILSIDGAGVVRWLNQKSTDASPAHIGIEFNYLREDCRAQVITLVDALKRVPYIPKGALSNPTDQAVANPDA